MNRVWRWWCICVRRSCFATTRRRPRSGKLVCSISLFLAARSASLASHMSFESFFRWGSGCECGTGAPPAGIVGLLTRVWTRPRCLSADRWRDFVIMSLNWSAKLWGVISPVIALVLSSNSGPRSCWAWCSSEAVNFAWILGSLRRSQRNRSRGGRDGGARSSGIGTGIASTSKCRRMGLWSEIREQRVRCAL